MKTASCSNCEHRERCAEDGRLIWYNISTDTFVNEHAILNIGRTCPLNYHSIDSFELARGIEKAIAELNLCTEQDASWETMEQFMGELIDRLNKRSEKNDHH